MYDRILVAIDDSDTAARALEHAIGLATEIGAAVSVLTVVEPTRSSLLFGVEEVDELNEAATRLVERTRESTAGIDLEVRVDVRRGKPADVILEYAAEIDAELLCVGQRGTDGLAEELLGSTTDRLAERTSIPLTIVPSSEEERRLR